MKPVVRNRRVIRCPLPSNRLLQNLIRLLFFTSLIPALGTVVMAQGYKQGQPVVGNAGNNGPAASGATIDATLFTTGGDMCGNIAAACQSSNAPVPTTIDARGFTGAQVCLASSVTKMLNSCAGNGGGKLLLGNVNVYADGPTAGATGNYSDSLGSGIGTPAFLLPSEFWGIEGLSRGSGDSGSSFGTWLSICLGSNNPVGLNHIAPGPGSGPCNHAFPQRSFPISSTMVGTTSGTTTMTITVSGTLVISGASTNVYPGELVMVKGSGTTSNNGTFAIQAITAGVNGTISVTVPTGTAVCPIPPGSCGTVFLGTPILGFASTGTAYNDSSCFPSACAGFGEHIKNLGFNCQAYDGCIGWQNLYAQEESGADTFAVNNYVFVGVDVRHNAQNFGPILNAEVYTGKNSAGSNYTNCAEGTTGIYVADKEMRGLNDWTINVPSESTDSPPTQSVCLNGTNHITPIAAVMLDAFNTEVRNGHCEGFVNCVLVGANNGGTVNKNASAGRVAGITGPPSGNTTVVNTVQISGNYPTNNTSFLIESIRKQGDANAVQDNIQGITLQDPFVGSYAWDTNSSNTDIVTTDASIRNRFDGGIRTGTIESGLSTNTDLAGQCTLSGPGPGSCAYQFTQTYNGTFPPLCTCSDATAINACRVQVGGIPLKLTITGTTGDAVDYICIGRN